MTTRPGTLIVATAPIGRPVAGPTRPRPWTPWRREAAGTPRKEAAGAVAAESDLPRRDVYDAVVAARRS